MLSYEILDGFVFAFVQFNYWIHVLILCFLGFAICALCHRSGLHTRVVGGHFSMSFLYFIYFFFLSLITACYHFSVSPSTLLLLSLGPSSLLSQESLLIGWCLLHFRTMCQFAYHRAIVYCLLRKSLGCLNRLVYMALLGEVSIG